MAEADPTRRIVSIDLADASALRQSAEAEQERAVAIFDLIEENEFAPTIEHPGPYHLVLGIADNKLVFDVRDTGRQEVYKFILSLTPFRRIIKEYFEVCESYYAAIKASSLSQIEAIDMGRRGLHNEGSEILRDRLAGKVEMDFGTARRLFTLICALHMKT
ncbi:MAG TPA: UPF0262 family protein [Dongiaceae bacterium]|jgi:uncharacterized protein (UPF0262 family)|nr:UPF0262 family protein [Dongiaceae bacterium]HSE73603.1 UPF0262 family protein [Dongiaceae bacterium]